MTSSLNLMEFLSKMKKTEEKFHAVYVKKKLVTQKFCASCLDNAISEATINISAKMNAKDKAKKTKKRKLSETFVLQATKVRRMNTFPLLPPEYKIPKQEIYNDDLDYKYIRALSTML